jgi:hypothetical protein
MMTKQLRIAICLGLLTYSATALAQDKASISTARELAKQGFQAYDEGRYEEAVEKSRAAYEVVRVPTLAVNLARALTKLGRLIEASELYLEATQLPRSEPWQAVQDEALRDAERERAELLPRIPRLRIIIEGADQAQLTVTIDNQKVPASLVGTEQMVDPGQRVVVGKRGPEEAREIVSAKAGEHLQVKLRFAGDPPVVPPGVASPDSDASPSIVVLATNVAPPTAPVATNQPTTATNAAMTAAPASGGLSKHPSTQTVLGWVGVGLGTAGLVLGAIESAASKSKRNSMIATGLCPDEQRCDPSLAGDVNAYMTMRALSTVGFVAGGILATAGVALLVIPSKREPQPRAATLTKRNAAPRIALRLGPSFLGVQAGFE